VLVADNHDFVRIGRERLWHQILPEASVDEAGSCPSSRCAAATGLCSTRISVRAKASRSRAPVSIVMFGGAAVELLPPICESNGLQRADLAVGGVVRHSGNARIYEQVARLDVLRNADQFFKQRGGEITPTGIGNPLAKPHGILRIENAVGGSFISRGIVAAVGGGSFGNIIVNDGCFDNGSGARLNASPVTNRGQFVNAGRGVRDVQS
jgi:hypothetical protein